MRNLVSALAIVGALGFAAAPVLAQTGGGMGTGTSGDAQDNGAQPGMGGQDQGVGGGASGTMGGSSGTMGGASGAPSGSSGRRSTGTAGLTCW